MRRAQHALGQSGGMPRRLEAAVGVTPAQLRVGGKVSEQRLQQLLVGRCTKADGIGQALSQGGALVRDAWRFGERVTLNAGVRYERYHVYLPAQSKPVGRFYPAGDYPATEVLTWNNWAPRAGLSVPLGESKRTCTPSHCTSICWPIHPGGAP